MKTLFLLRHAKAVPGHAGLDDHARALNARGREDCPRIGGWLAARGAAPQQVLCSDAVRTRETAERVAACLVPPPPIASDAALYLASAEQMLARLRALDPALSRVMLVGHNPGIQDLVVGLSDGSQAGETERARRKFPTAALAELHCPIERWDGLRPAGAALVQLVVPRALS